MSSEERRLLINVARLLNDMDPALAHLYGVRHALQCLGVEVDQPQQINIVIDENASA